MNIESLVFSNNDEAINLLRIIKQNISIKNYKKAAKNYRTLGKLAIVEKIYKQAYECFQFAAQYNNQLGLFERELADHLYSIEVMKIINDKIV